MNAAALPGEHAERDDLAHVFVLSSPVTELAAAGVIALERLPRERVLLLCARGYLPSRIDAPRESVPFGPGAREPFPIWTPGGRGRIRRFDGWLRERCGGRRFHYYTANLRNRYQRVIASSPDCDGYSFLEVGLSSYRTREELRRLFPPRRAGALDRWMHGDRLGTKTQYPDGYQRVYGLGSESFPGFPRRVELDVAFDDKPVDVPELERVLVFDGMSAHRKVRRSAVASALSRLLERLRNRGIDRFHYKFHPAQTFAGEDEHFERWLDANARGFERTRLGPEVMLESVAQRQPGTDFFVGVSSLGIYAAQAGCRVESYARWIVASGAALRTPRARPARGLPPARGVPRLSHPPAFRHSRYAPSIAREVGTIASRSSFRNASNRVSGT